MKSNSPPLAVFDIVVDCYHKTATLLLQSIFINFNIRQILQKQKNKKTKNTLFSNLSVLKKKSSWHHPCPSISIICLSQCLKDSHCSTTNPPNLQGDSEVNCTPLCQHTSLLYYPPTGNVKQCAPNNNIFQMDDKMSSCEF